MIIAAQGEDHLNAVRRLFREYAEAIGVDLEFQGFSAELASLPGEYGPPGGAILLAQIDGNFVGCVAVRRLEEGVCEMKRLYVAPTGRGHGLGRKLAEAIIARAGELGYRKMRLDTLATMSEARQLYASLDFEPTEPYCYNPLPGAEYYERDL